MIRKFTFPAPVSYINGDTFEKQSGLLLQKRGNAIVQAWQLSQLESQPVETFEIIGDQITSLYLETTMPGQNVSMTNVRENQTTGVIIVDFSSGTQLEFASWADVGSIADNIDAIPELAEKILLGKAYRASPDGTNKTTQIGASVSTNLLASEPVVYTEAQ